MARPQPGYTFSIHRIHVGLATVPMAVAASSAYPGFFPPLELTGAEVGARLGEFGRQSFTDGGVFDNLGVRMFRCLERPLMADTPLSAEDFVDLRETVEVLRRAGQSHEESPLRRLWQVAMATGNGGGGGGGGRQEPLLLAAAEAKSPASSSSPPLALLESGNGHGNGNGDSEDAVVISRMWEAMRRYSFYYDPLFAGLRPPDADAETYLRANRSTARILDMADRLWLNRHMLEAAFRQATGRPCFRRLNSGLDGVLVSDVGKPIEVQSDRRHGGVIRTALRASDILMDRVWQLEKETFHDTPGFVFAPITDVVDPADDPTALHPEIQLQAANIRTDLDRFSPLEISTLVRHGYCVGRKACRARPDLFGDALPDNAPWDPIPAARGAAPPAPKAARLDGPPKCPAPATLEARNLQASAFRRIWSALPDYRDWTSFVYVPILVPLLFLLPYVAVKYYQRSHRISQLVESLSQGSQDLAEMSQLLETPSLPWKGVAFEEISKPAVPDIKGFEILQDSRVLDLRNWQPSLARMNDPSSLLFGYRRVKVARAPDREGDDTFYITLLAMDPDRTAVRFPPQELRPRLLRATLPTTNPTDKLCRWQIAYDFRQVPPGEFVDVMAEYHSPGGYVRRGETSSTLPLDIHTFTAEFTLWVMLPTGKQRKGWRVVRYPHDKPQEAETVRVVTEYLSEDASILAFKLLSLKPDFSYEVQWFYR